MSAKARHQLEDRIEFRLLFAVTFTVFLAAALLGRLLPNAGGAERLEPRRSLVGRARQAANTCVPYAFMG